jgi:hypothetical protein
VCKPDIIYGCRHKETPNYFFGIEFGRFIRLLDELRIHLTFDMELPQYEQLKAMEMKPLPPRERKQEAKDSSPISSGRKT